MKLGFLQLVYSLGLLDIDYDMVSHYTTCYPAATCG